MLSSEGAILKSLRNEDIVGSDEEAETGFALETADDAVQVDAPVDARRLLYGLTITGEEGGDEGGEGEAGGR
jgi:hypothetical protein